MSSAISTGTWAFWPTEMWRYVMNLIAVTYTMEAVLRFCWTEVFRVYLVVLVSNEGSYQINSMAIWIRSIPVVFDAGVFVYVGRKEYVSLLCQRKVTFSEVCLCALSSAGGRYLVNMMLLMRHMNWSLE